MILSDVSLLKDGIELESEFKHNIKSSALQLQYAMVWMAYLQSLQSVHFRIDPHTKDTTNSLNILFNDDKPKVYLL